MWCHALHFQTGESDSDNAAFIFSNELRSSLTDEEDKDPILEQITEYLRSDPTDSTHNHYKVIRGVLKRIISFMVVLCNHFVVKDFEECYNEAGAHFGFTKTLAWVRDNFNFQGMRK